MKNLILWLKKLIGWPEPAVAAPAVAPAPAAVIPPIAAPAPAPVSVPVPAAPPPIVAPVVSAPVLTAPTAKPQTLADMIGHPLFDPADSATVVAPDGAVRTWPKPHPELGENAWGYATRASQMTNPATGQPFFNGNILGTYLLGTPGGADGQAEERAGQFHYTADRFMYGESWSGKPAQAAKPPLDENKAWNSVGDLIAGAAASSNQTCLTVDGVSVVVGFGPPLTYVTSGGKVMRGAYTAPVAAPAPAPVPAPQEGTDVVLED